MLRLRSRSAMEDGWARLAGVEIDRALRIDWTAAVFRNGLSRAACGTGSTGTRSIRVFTQVLTGAERFGSERFDALHQRMSRSRRIGRVGRYARRPDPVLTVAGLAVTHDEHADLDAFVIHHVEA